MSFFSHKIAIRTRISSEFVYLFPFSLQVHGPRALCGSSPALLHQDLREIQKEHGCECGGVPVSPGWLWWEPPADPVLCFFSRSCTITGWKATAQPNVINATKRSNATRV